MNSKRVIGGLVLGCGFLSLLFLGFAWLNFRSEDLLEEAKVAWEAGNVYDAREFALKYLDGEPNSKEAIAVMIHASQAFKSGDEVEWRYRYWKLEQTYPALATYVDAAVRLGDLERAHVVLDGAERIIGEKELLVMRAYLDIAESKLEGAIDRLEAALRLDETGDDELLMNLAVLLSEDEKSYRRAFEILKRIDRSSGLYPQARVGRLNLIVKGAVFENPRDMAEEILEGDSPLADCFVALDALVAYDEDSAAEVYRAALARRGQHDQIFLGLITWGLRDGRLDWVDDWLKLANLDDYGHEPVCWAIAGVMWLKQDEGGLEDWLVKLAPNYEDNAYFLIFSRALSMLDSGSTSMILDRSTVQKVAVDLGASAERIRTFVAFSELFKMGELAEDIYWRIARDNDEMAFLALGILYENYTAAKDTKGLYRVMNRMVLLNPRDNKLKNNLAALGLLLEEDVKRMERIAEGLILEEPDNELFLSTAAFSAYKQGDIRRAKDLMDRIDVEDREKMPILFYNLLILHASGEQNRVKALIKGLDLDEILPEEYSLVNLIQESL